VEKIQNVKLSWIFLQFATLLNLLVVLIAARHLDKTNFGNFTTAVASLTLILSLLNPIANEYSRIVAKSKTVPIKILIRLIFISLLFGIPIFILANRFSWIGNINLYLYSILICLSLSLSTFISSIFIGLNLINIHSIAQSVGALFKIQFIFLVAIFIYEFRYFVDSYFIGYITTIIISLFYIKNFKLDGNFKEKIFISKIIGFFLLASIFSIDQILVQNYYPNFSGTYAGITTYTKSIFLVSASFLTISFSNGLQTTNRKNFIISTIIKFLCFSLLLASTICLLSPILMPLILGVSYKELTSLVFIPSVTIAIYIMSYSTLQLLISWFDKKNTNLICISLFIPILLMYVGFKSFSINTINEIFLIVLFSFLLQFIIAIIFSFKFLSECRPKY
jgi:hypothetical protein